jgi:hypothetical protein
MRGTGVGGALGESLRTIQVVNIKLNSQRSCRDAVGVAGEIGRDVRRRRGAQVRARKVVFVLKCPGSAKGFAGEAPPLRLPASQQCY